MGLTGRLMNTHQDKLQPEAKVCVRLRRANADEFSFCPSRAYQPIGLDYISIPDDRPSFGALFR